MLTSKPTVRVLTAADAEAYFSHRREALLDAPLAFAASPEDDVASSPSAVRKILTSATGSTVFGAFSDGLIGSVGIHHDSRRRKSAHKALIWGMYVAPQFRKRGVGRDLLDAAITHVRSLSGVRQVHLSVTEWSSDAQRLYESIGFRVWGTEPSSIEHEGECVDEHHMVLML